MLLSGLFTVRAPLLFKVRLWLLPVIVGSVKTPLNVVFPLNDTVPV